MKTLIFILVVLIMSINSVLSQNKISIAVIDLKSSGLAKSEAGILSDRLRTELCKSDKFIVLERDKMNEVLQEQGFQLSGCTTKECVVEAGKLIGVEQMVAGSVAKIGKIYTTNLRLIDVETGKVVQTATDDCDCAIETVLTQSIKKVALILAGEIGPDQQSKIKEEDLTPNEQQSQEKISDKISTKEDRLPKLFIGLTWCTGSYTIASSNAGFSSEVILDLSDGYNIYAYYMFHRKWGLMLLYNKSTLDNTVDSFTYTGNLDIISARLVWHFLSWLYITGGYSFSSANIDIFSDYSDFSSTNLDSQEYTKSNFVVSIESNLRLFWQVYLNMGYQYGGNYQFFTIGCALGI